MTREEAIISLDMANVIPIKREAVDMAIKAIEFVSKLAEVEKLYEEYKIDAIEKSKRIADLYREIGI